MANRTDLHYKRMTETRIYKLIILLGIPTTISMLITNIYNMVDTYFVGTLGKSAQAATGILFTLQCIIQAIAFMLGHGSGTNVGKELANRDIKKASVYVSTAFMFGLVLSTLLLIFGLLFLEPFMVMLGSSETVLPYSMEYGMWVLISAPFMVTSLILNNNLRYEGKAFYAMIGLGLGGILNIIGDYVFVKVMNLGIFGAGMSTGISQIISFFVLIMFYYAKAQSKLSIKYFSPSIKINFQILRTGFPSLIRQGLSSISSGILNNLTKPFGDGAVAAMSVVNKCSSFVMCVGMGIGQGLQPVSAFNYQAKKYQRVKDGTVFTIWFGTILVTVLSTFGILFPRQIIYAFQKDQEVIEYGYMALKYASIGLLFLPLSTTSNMLFQSIRKSEIASLLALLRSGLAFIPMLYLFQSLNFGFTGIAIAQPVADIITGILSYPFVVGFILIDHSKKDRKKEAAL